MDFQKPPAEFVVRSEEIADSEASTLNSLTILAQNKGEEKKVGQTENRQATFKQDKNHPQSFNELDARAKESVLETYYKNHQEPPIGDASMNKEGTIFLRLRSAGGMPADAQIQYKKGSTHYEEVMKHLGGMKPGEIKLVPPWPDTDTSRSNSHKGESR
ncbi:hypothetical protein GC174_03865 [bacterium]|nr:hypothetical protein [bacterium]